MNIGRPGQPIQGGKSPDGPREVKQTAAGQPIGGAKEVADPKILKAVSSVLRQMGGGAAQVAPELTNSEGSPPIPIDILLATKEPINVDDAVVPETSSPESPQDISFDITKKEDKAIQRDLFYSKKSFAQKFKRKVVNLFRKRNSEQFLKYKSDKLGEMAANFLDSVLVDGKEVSQEDRSKIMLELNEKTEEYIAKSDGLKTKNPQEVKLLQDEMRGRLKGWMQKIDSVAQRAQYKAAPESKELEFSSFDMGGTEYTLELDKPIASGAFGSIVDVSTGQADEAPKVAKIMHVSENEVLEGDASNTEEGLRELHYLTDLDHPNILHADAVAKLEKSGSDSFDYVAILPKATEGSFRTFMADEKRRADPEKFYKDNFAMMEQAADGLSYMHDKHLIHRDIKPDNFLVFADSDSESGLKLSIADLGSISNSGDTEELNEGRGTPHYMAAEVYENTLSESSRPEVSDVYQLGVVLFESIMGDGHYPYAPNGTNANAMQLSMMIINSPDVEIDALPKDLPHRDKVEDLLIGMLAKDPNSRLNMSEVKDRLHEINSNLN